MGFRRLCFVAAFAAMVSMAFTGCNSGGYGGIPTTSGMPDSSDDGGTQMPEQSSPESSLPEPSEPATLPSTPEQPSTPSTPMASATASPTTAPFLPPRTVSVTVRLSDKKIPPGSYIWFDAAFAPDGASTGAFEMQNSRLTLAGHTYDGPTGIVDVTPTVKTASVTVTGADSIVSVYPPAVAKKSFMDGVIVYLPAGLPAHQTATWSARFHNSSSTTGGMKVQWQWIATAYSRFTKSYRSLRLDSSGTPKGFAKNVIPGTRSAGSANLQIR